jgi:hypothetical protein
MFKKTIDLFTLEKLWAEHLEKETGKIIRPEHPMELNPGYGSYCRRSWGAWDLQKEKRTNQLAKMNMLEDYQIDFYLTAEPIRPV